jgi:hypothetical protein
VNATAKSRTRRRSGPDLIKDFFNSIGQIQPPSFVAAMAELASIADASKAWRGPSTVGTLMQNLIARIDENLLLRTAGKLAKPEKYSQMPAICIAIM